MMMENNLAAPNFMGEFYGVISFNRLTIIAYFNRFSRKLNGQKMAIKFILFVIMNLVLFMVSFSSESSFRLIRVYESFSRNLHEIHQKCITNQDQSFDETLKDDSP